MSTGRYRKERNCLNCGHQVEEHFCSHCGQENLELKEDALHMITHAVADYFHFESKFFATLKPLLFQPGRLTTQYVGGKRVTFIHPIRLYIFVSIVFFLFTLNSGHDEPTKPAVSAKQDTASNVDTQLLESTLKNVPMPGVNRDSLSKNIVDQARKSDRKEKLSGKDLLDVSYLLTKTDTTIAAYEDRQLKLPKDKRDGLIVNYIAKKSIKFRNYPDASKRLEEDLIHNIPKLMFVLLPLFALILKLVYFRKKKFYYEHLIYSFHIHSAMFLSVLLFMLINWIFHFFYDIHDLLITAWMLYFMWYIYRSLRNFYGSRRWITIFKIMFLSLSYFIVFTLSIMLVIVVTAMMF